LKLETAELLFYLVLLSPGLVNTLLTPLYWYWVNKYDGRDDVDEEMWRRFHQEQKVRSDGR